jgi:hypothetical protein
MLIIFEAKGGYVRTVSLPFKGPANGGTLIVGNTLNRNAYFAGIKTSPGESAESVIDRLAWDICCTESLFEKSDHITHDVMHDQLITGGLLRLPGSTGTYFIAGTETGLGIPLAPRALTAFYLNGTGEIYIKWDNPPDDYDEIVLIAKWNDYDSGYSKLLPGKSKEYRIKQSEVFCDLESTDIWVIGIKEGLPSAPGAITLSEHGTTLQELCGIPFTNGLAPNWETWNTSDISKKAFQERVRDDYVPFPRYRPIIHGSQKPYVQLIKVPNEEKGGVVGVYRRFVGLRGGHTYRVSIRINTNMMDDTCNNDWAVSVHIAYHNGTLNKSLSEGQFLGRETLPAGVKGLQAGRISEFKPQNITRGKYVTQTSQITLPIGADSITVWVRHGSSVATSGVSIDWIELKELGKLAID